MDESFFRKRLKRLHAQAKEHDPIRDWLFSENRPRILYLKDKRQQN